MRIIPSPSEAEIIHYLTTPHPELLFTVSSWLQSEGEDSNRMYNLSFHVEFGGKSTIRDFRQKGSRIASFLPNSTDTGSLKVLFCYIIHLYLVFCQVSPLDSEALFIGLESCQNTLANIGVVGAEPRDTALSI